MKRRNFFTRILQAAGLISAAPFAVRAETFKPLAITMDPRKIIEMQITKSRKNITAGYFAATSLAEIQDIPKQLARRICHKHLWKESRYSRTCNRCGITEYK